MNVPSNNKMLYLASGADAAFCFRAHELRGLHMDGDDSIVLQFSDVASLTQGSPNATAEITVANEKQKEVMQAIANEIAFGNSAFVVIADEVNSVYLTTDITSCDAVTFDTNASA
jgi:hypothetical protein